MVESCFLESRKEDLDGHQRCLYDVDDPRLCRHLLVVVCQNLDRAASIVLKDY